MGDIPADMLRRFAEFGALLLDESGWPAGQGDDDGWYGSYYIDIPEQDTMDYALRAGLVTDRHGTPATGVREALDRLLGEDEPA